MEEFYINLNNPQDIELLESYKAYVKGTQPFVIQKTFKEKIKDKLDSTLKKTFNATYNGAMDYVEGSTIDTFFGKEIDKVQDKMDIFEVKRSESAAHLEDEEEVRYTEFFNKELSKLQRTKIKLLVDKTRPHDVSSLVLPRIVVMQLQKNMAKKWAKVEKVTDDTLLAFVDGLDKSQLGKLKKIIQERMDEKDNKKHDSMPQVEILDEDPLIEDAVVDVVETYKMKK